MLTVCIVFYHNRLRATGVNISTELSFLLLIFFVMIGGGGGGGGGYQGAQESDNDPNNTTVSHIFFLFIYS